MRRQRVGTVSLGIVLIVLGIGMLAAQLKKMDILNALLTWWPIILVLIGGEILWYVYNVKEQEPRIKYDALSIFLVMIIVFLSIGLYALTAVGVIEKISRRVASSITSVEIPSKRIELDKDIKRIVISIPRGEYDIKKNNIRNVAIFGQAQVSSLNYNEAQSLVEQNDVVSYREGDNLFIGFLDRAPARDFKPYISKIGYTILIPSDINIEVNSTSYFNMDIEGEALSGGGDWLIKGNGRVVFTIGDIEDLKINVQALNSGSFRGNVAWEIEGPEEELPDSSALYRGHKTWGQGNNRVDIFLDNGEVVVNEL